MKKRVPRATPRQKRWPDLSVDEILAWADAHFARSAEWPTADSGAIAEAPREKWHNVDTCLRQGLRGLLRGSSLARLLQQHRGVRNRKALPPLTVRQILAWADVHQKRTDKWPTRVSGPIFEAPGETWMAVDMALGKGLRGLPGDSSLAQLLSRHRHTRNKGDLPLFKIEQILAWADAHYGRTGRWPMSVSGPIAAAPGETWCAVDRALRRGTRGLEGGSSLARLLEQRRSVPNLLNRPRLTVEQVLRWADAHRKRTGRWPTRCSGAVEEAPGERWSAIDTCLHQGNRGLPRDSSLARLLAEQRGARNRGKPVRSLTVAQILAWADAYHQSAGRWPQRVAGAIAEAPEETWMAIDQALKKGGRGLPGGLSLPRLLAEYRQVRHRGDRPPLAEAQILEWADAFHAGSGRWPTVASGVIAGTGGETWNRVNKALHSGSRGLPGGSTLARLLAARRGVLSPDDRPPLSVEQILGWADAYYAHTGQWPTRISGRVQEAPEESWYLLNRYLVEGRRGLPRGTSLSCLLTERRGVDHHRRPELPVEQILEWADAHYARHGRWPQVRSGAIDDAPGETWAGVESALRNGCRGFPGGSTLRRLIQKYRTT